VDLTVVFTTDHYNKKPCYRREDRAMPL